MKARASSPRQITWKNHFTPRLYLERFALDGKISVYKTLVEHANVPCWKSLTSKGVGYFTNLYTETIKGVEVDTIERWLEEEIETPATHAIERALNQASLRKTDWINIIRFAAAQDVRTPARLSEALHSWRPLVESTLDKSLEDLKAKLRESSTSGNMPRLEDVVVTTDECRLPVRLDMLPDGSDHMLLRAEIIAGRSLWLYSIRHLLTESWKKLADHHWTILKAPNDVTWFTSDDPVMKLNVDATGRYSFGGGWASVGTQIIMPLSPRHMLYAKVGSRPPEKGSVLSVEEANCFRRLIAEHAFRAIYAPKHEEDVLKWRPRVVNASVFKMEAEALKDFHRQQTEAEWELLTKPIRAV